MARAHLFRPVTDEKGNLLYGATVTVRLAQILATLDQPIYTGPLVGAAVRENPFTIDGGYVDIWLDTPTRLNLYIESAGREPISVYLDANPPASEVMRSLYPLSVTNQSATGKVLTGVDPVSASWQDPPTVVGGTVPVHQHDGAGSNSTAVGTGVNATGAYATAVGDYAVASGPRSTAFGAQASANDDGGTAMGYQAEADGPGGTAFGRNAHAVDGGVAVGADAVASGVNAGAVGNASQAYGAGAIAVGQNAAASGTSSVALGQGSIAQGEGSVAVGAGAQATNARSGAFGNGAITTSDDQVALGATGSTTVVTGDLVTLGSARLAGPSSLLGFFGSMGATKQTVTGGDGGDLALRALLGYLDGLGLITNASTQE